MRNHPQEVYDATAGQMLKKELVEKAMEEEMVYFRAKVWIKRPMQEAFDRIGKPPISVKRVDVNKGDDYCFLATKMKT